VQAGGGGEFETARANAEGARLPGGAGGEADAEISG